MAMENHYQHEPATPQASPLRQLSADQMNTMNPPRIPQSPSMPQFHDENSRISLHRSRESISSDVQTKVALFSSLSNPSSPTKNARGLGFPHTPSQGALQRALLGFEESQASLASATAEIERLKEQIKSSKHRERMVSERIESLMDQIQTERESRSNDKKFYVAEVKKCRKQAYQAEVGQLETNETLKQTKQELKRAQAEVAAERSKKEAARQEAFERAYAVSGLTEELETVKATLKAVEKERNTATEALRNAPAPDVVVLPLDDKAVQTSPLAQIQSNGGFEESQITPRPLKRAHPDHYQPERVQAKHKKQMPQEHDCSKAISEVLEPFWTDYVERDRALRDLHDEPYSLEDHVQSLYREIEATRDLAERHREQIEYLHIECEVGCCACRRAEKNGERYIYDPNFGRATDAPAMKKRKLDAPPKLHETEILEVESAQIESTATTTTHEPETETEHYLSRNEVVEVSHVDHDADPFPKAALIPLPEPTEHELEFTDRSAEPTAVLEDMTQVMVDPSFATSKHGFSVSISSQRPELPASIQSYPAVDIAEPEPDLFDMSKPKHHPPRPSTAMGILTVASPENSPIRLVPDSPVPSMLQSRSAPRHNDHFEYSSHTTRVALKDSPARPHRRTQSRPNIRSQSRTRSPLTKSESIHQFTKSPTASPAADTIFPITPLLKHARAARDQHTFATTTTTIPLRDEDDTHSQVAHTPAPAKSHTQPLQIPLKSHDDLSSSTASSSSSSLLKGVTGTPVSRDAALAQIRARRDRARSMNMKKMEGTGHAAGGKTPGSARRGITLRDLGREDRERDREVSVASVQTAPGRF
jgi:hypothetical protein